MLGSGLLLTCPIEQYQQTIASHMDIMLRVQVQFEDSILGSGLLLTCPVE